MRVGLSHAFLRISAETRSQKRVFSLKFRIQQRLYEQYLRLADEEKRVIFGGRLGNYKYYDMDDVILAAMEDTAKLL